MRLRDSSLCSKGWKWMSEARMRENGYVPVGGGRDLSGSDMRGKEEVRSTEIDEEEQHISVRLWARRQLHPHAGISQLPGGRAHQHEGFGRGELHRFRCGALQAPLNGRKHAQGAAHAFQQHFTRLVHTDLSKL